MSISLVMSPLESAFAIVTSGVVTGGTALTLDGGVFQILTPPIGPVGNDNHQSSNLFAFDETQNVVIPAGGITTDQCFGDVGTCPIPEGTIVASHYVFFDPGPTRTQDGTVDFDSDVYAIISGTANLLASDFLITTNADYQNPGARGIEGGDTISRTGPQQITVDWAASTPGDYIRILTVFSPGGEEVCDGMDNDGDGEIDEGLNCDVVPQCGDMYGSGGNDFGVTGSIFLVSQTDGSQIPLGVPNPDGGISGIAFDDQARLWGSTVFGGGTTSGLIEINPSDGSLISDVGPIQLPGNDNIKVTDLAWDPVSKQLFGAERDGDLVTIDRTTGAATSVGTLSTDPAHIGFAPDGTLYMVSRDSGELFTIDPTNANDFTDVTINPDIEVDALGVDPATGIIWVSQGSDESIYTLTTDGILDLIGEPRGDSVADLAFLPCPPKQPTVVGGELIPIETTSLLLASAQTFSWMIPVVLSGIGIGMFVVSRKSQ